MAKKPGKAYVKARYNKYARLYFPNHVLPEFDSLDFEFASHPGEWGSVEWEHGSPSLSLDPMLRNYPDFLRSTLIHEMAHLALGEKKGHGKEFYDLMLNAASLGAIRILS